MGPKGVPSYFQEKLQTEVFQGMIGDIVEVYIDDVIIWADTETQLIERIRLVLERLELYNISVNPEKCHMGKTRIEFVGHTLDAEGLHFSPEKLRAVGELRLPTNQQELKSFLGVASYFRDHVENHANLSRDLQAMITPYHPRSRVKWTTSQTILFDKLKHAVVTCPKLFFLTNGAPVYLRTDASDYGIGAYLFQKVTDDITGVTREHPVAFLSKALTGPQLRWSTIEKEAYAIYHAVTKWEYYLQDIHFILQTDHANLTFINANSKGKVQRWKLELQDYDFDVQHIPGVNNNVADYFSRGVPLPQGDELSEPRETMLLALQTSLNVIDEAGVVNYYHEGEQNDLLYNEISSLYAAMGRPALLSPDRAEVLGRAHCTHPTTRKQKEAWYNPETKEYTRIKHSIVGHGGVEATIRNLHKIAAYCPKAQATIASWEGMRKDVKAYINQCPCCQKMGRLKIAIQTKPFTIATYGLWDCVAMDSIGPLPVSKSGCAYILVIIDTFSRYVELVPIPDTTANNAVKAIVPFIGRYGIPSAFLTDNGTQFVNETVRLLMETIECQHLTVHPYSHEENGIVERANKEVMRHLRDIIFATNNPNEWDDKLPFVQRILNAQVHTATGVTPSELVFGKSLDLNRNILTRTVKPIDTSMSDYITKLIKDQDEILKRAMASQRETDIHKIQQAMKKGNLNAETEFPIHSYVLTKYEDRGGPKPHHPPTGLHPTLRGPFRVIKKTRRGDQGTIYTCQHMATNKLMDFHVTVLQPFTYNSTEILPEDIARSDYNLFEVDKIINHRWTNGKATNRKSELEFLVKWEGYSDSENTWEPWKNMSKVGVVHDYMNAINELRKFVSKDLLTTRQKVQETSR